MRHAAAVHGHRARHAPHFCFHCISSPWQPAILPKSACGCISRFLQPLAHDLLPGPRAGGGAGSVRGPQAASAEPSGAEGGTPGPHRPRPYPDTLRGENTSSCTFFLKPSRPPFPSEIGEVEPGQDAFRTSNSHLSESPGHEEGPRVLPAGTAEKGRKRVKTGKKPGACRRVGE